MYRLILCLLAVLGCAPAMAQTFPSPTFLNLTVNGTAALNNGSIAGIFTGGTLSGTTFTGGTLGGSITATGATITGGTLSGITLAGIIPGTPIFSGDLTLSGTKLTLGSGSGGFTLDGTGSSGNFTIKTGGPLLKLQDSSGADIMRFSKATTAVNFFTATNAATGGPPILSVGGTDSNISLRLKAVGTGTVQLTSALNLSGVASEQTFSAVYSGSDPGTAGTTRGIDASQSFSGTTSGSPTLDRWWITANTVATPANGTNGFGFLENFGPLDSSQRMMQLRFTQDGNIGPDSAFLVTLQPQIILSHDLGGGAGTETINTNHNMASGATNSAGQLDFEQDILAATGSGFIPAAGRFGIGTFLTAGNTVAAPQWDTAYMVAVVASSDPTDDVVPWRTVWQFGKGASQPVVDTTIGRFLDVYPQSVANANGQPTRPLQALRGFDTSKYNFTDALIWSPGLRLAAAEIDNGALRTYQGTNGPIIDAAFSKGAVTSFTINGLSYAVGDQVPDRLGGILSIDTIDGSGHPLTWHYITAPYSRSGASVVVATGINTVAGVTGNTILNVANRPDYAAGDTVLSPSTTSIPGATTISSITTQFSLTTSTDTPSGTTLTTASTASVVNNAQVTGPCMPLGAKVASFVVNTSITLNAAVQCDVPSATVLTVGPFITLSAALTGAIPAQSPIEYQLPGLATTVPMPVGGTGNGQLVATVSWTAPGQTTLGHSKPVFIGPEAAMTGAAGEFGIAKISDPASAPGAGVVKITAEAGTNAGSCKLVVRAGTSATPITIQDNIGSGC